MQWRVPLSDVTVGEEEVAAVAEVLRSGWLTQGARVEAFERAFAERLGARHAVGVTNGTAALHLAYEAAGLAAGDEFILPALTFVATLNAGLYLGARPVLADCMSPQDLTLSAADVARKITPRTRLIVTMPYGGFCPDMEALAGLANERGIPLVEDACHAPLAEVGGRRIGTFGLASTFSFFSNKNLTTGEGGMVLTDSDDVAARVRRLRSHGMTTLTWDRHRGHAADYDVTDVGFNYRLDEVRAAIGLEQLRKLDAATERRREAARLLREALHAAAIPGLEIPFEQPRGVPVHHLFVILLPPDTDRRAFREAMTARGIQTSMHYPLLHRFTVAKQHFAEPPAVPVAEAVGERLVTLPMGPHLSAESVGWIATAVRESVSSVKGAA
jgi:dTDP-4-amino-4,6-dideoxygalactose transaminase